MDSLPDELLIHLSLYTDDKTRHRMMQVCRVWYTLLTSDNAISQVTKKKCRYRSVEYREYLLDNEILTLFNRRKWKRYTHCMMITGSIVLLLVLCFTILSVVSICLHFRLLDRCENSRSKIQWWKDRYYNKAKCNDSNPITIYGKEGCYVFNDDGDIYLPWQCIPRSLVHIEGGEIIDTELASYIHCYYEGPVGKNCGIWNIVESIQQICNITLISWHMRFRDKCSGTLKEIPCYTYMDNVSLDGCI